MYLFMEENYNNIKITQSNEDIIFDETKSSINSLEIHIKSAIMKNLTLEIK